MDSEDKFAVVMMLIVSVTIVAITFMCVSCTCNSATAATEDVATLSQDASPAIEHANGCPLDAVAYDAPAFVSGWNDAYKVTDRFSGQTWWMIKMDGKWVVLPIESKEAVDVG